MQRLQSVSSLSQLPGPPRMLTQRLAVILLLVLLPACTTDPPSLPSSPDESPTPGDDDDSAPTPPDDDDSASTDDDDSTASDDDDSGLPTPGRFTDVHAGNAIACGLDPKGEMLCWGWVKETQPGCDDPAYPLGDPPEGPFIQMDSDGPCMMGLRGDGSLLPADTNCGFTALLFDDYQFSQVDCVSSGCCAVQFDGSLFCWGNECCGEYSPPGGSGWLQVTTGWDVSCGIESTGELSCWGSDAQQQASAPDGLFSQVDCGGAHCCALAVSGEAACWGWGLHGGALAPEGQFVQVSSGFYSSCGLRPDGRIECWGGLNAPFFEEDVHPVAVPPSGSFSRLEVGSNFACALDTRGDITCWGAESAASEGPPPP